jgi:two-component system sensor histidine kinase KdpD
VDVVVGWVDTHSRAETEALLQGLEILPRRAVLYRGTTLDAFDLDAALARHPTLLLVDELAHTNAPGARHPKRWQDVEELLDAGINVYTTMNVQHLESLNDVIAQITGVVGRETVPDSILAQADEVELIDLPRRLAATAARGQGLCVAAGRTGPAQLFHKGNLIALRELALRRTADRVDAQMQVYRRDHAIAETWPYHRAHPGLRQPQPAGGAVGTCSPAHGNQPARRVARGLRRDPGAPAAAGSGPRPGRADTPSGRPVGR